jgi:hypothetical protein
MLAKSGNILDFLSPVIVDCPCCGTAARTIVGFALKFHIYKCAFFGLGDILYDYPFQSEQFFCKIRAEHIRRPPKW